MSKMATGGLIGVIVAASIAGCPKLFDGRWDGPRPEWARSAIERYEADPAAFVERATRAVTAARVAGAVACVTTGVACVPIPDAALAILGRIGDRIEAGGGDADEVNAILADTLAALNPEQAQQVQDAIASILVDGAEVRAE